MRGHVLALVFISLLLVRTPTPAAEPVDLVIYGGTSAGMAAAVQAKRMGLSVIVLEPSDRVGGLTTGGLGQTDIGNKSAIGGISREFYQDIARHYQDDSAWKWQRRDEYRSGGQSKTARGEDAMWTFEPSAALAVYQRWLSRDGIEVAYRQRLDRSAGVMMTRSRPARIIGIRTEAGDLYRGKMFLDATYEGDLMAAAGVSYTVGREANATYGETLNGVQTRRATKHQLEKGIDPFVLPGDPGSGLLPHIDPDGPGVEGDADHRLQAYCFRMCLTDHPDNRIPFAKPEGYQELWYELLFRNYEAGSNKIPWANSAMPNRKTDTNNNGGFSTDFIGQNYDYAKASYERRDEIVAEHLLYQKGLMWTLAYHPRVPERVRNVISRWGMCKDEFTEGGGWQKQIYVREARRMVGDYVMTQKNCQGLAVEDPVGLAAYTMDSHNQQRYVDADGQVRNEGDVQVGGFSPYGISQRSILPKREEVSNLVVPVCLSASHIAFGSIRMEPVFMVLGQSGATIAAIAIRQQSSVQEVDYEALSKQLISDKQKLVYDGPKRVWKPSPGIRSESLSGIVIDNGSSKTTGTWVKSSSSSPRINDDYLHDDDSNKGGCSVRFPLDVPAGTYRVILRWPPHSNRATNTPVTVTDASGKQTRVLVNQRDGSGGGKFDLGTFKLSAGSSVVISNDDTDGYVIADAIQVTAEGK